MSTHTATAGFDRRALEATAGFVRRREGRPLPDLRLEVRPLRGGLESAGVARVVARFAGRQGKPATLTFVAKRLAGGPAREAAIYERLVAPAAADLAPALLGVERQGADRCLLFLESVRAPRSWPWRETATARRLLERLAELHARVDPADAAPVLAGWDYETDLAAASGETISLLRAARGPDLAPLRRRLPAVERLATALPAMRRQLLEAPLGRAVLHGDVHPGNAMIRAGERPVLLDWGRARLGSPLEDVSSWLQSLGFWEPEAKRRHDTLLAAYLGAGGHGAPGRDLRDAYWLAAAGNALAGALAYHLRGVLDEGASPRHRAAAHLAAADALRVIRRADACWRS